MGLTFEQKRMLVDFARTAIRTYFDGRNNFEPDEAEIPYELCENKGVFVNLLSTKGSRGLAGYTDVVKPIWKGVIQSAVNAAFFDPKTKALTPIEFNDVDIEISVLNNATKVVYTSPQDLINKLQYNKGIIIKKGMHTATFLPYMWRQYREKTDFMDMLCANAGLREDDWETTKLEIYQYDAETFDEKSLK